MEVKSQRSFSQLKWELKDTRSVKKGYLWKLYFLVGGMVSLICWNSMLNLTNYFNHIISKDTYTYITWSFCFGGILSFILSPVLFQDLSNKKAVYLALICTYLTFILVLYFSTLNILFEWQIKKYVVIFSTFINGFFSYFL